MGMEERCESDVLILRFWLRVTGAQLCWGTCEEPRGVHLRQGCWSMYSPTSILDLQKLTPEVSTHPAVGRAPFGKGRVEGSPDCACMVLATKDASDRSPRLCYNRRGQGDVPWYTGPSSIIYNTALHAILQLAFKKLQQVSWIHFQVSTCLHTLLFSMAAFLSEYVWAS